MNGNTKKDARTTSRQFGQCVVARSPTLAQRLVDMPLGSPQFRRTMDRLVTSDCLGGDGELRMAAVLMRGAIIEGLYLRQFGVRGPSGIKTATPVDYAKGYQTPIHPDVANIIALAQFGDCVARADEANARALALSLPETVVEQRAIAALQPRYSPCVPAGSRIAFSRSVLRASIVEGLYRLSQAAVAR